MFDPFDIQLRQNRWWCILSLRIIEVDEMVSISKSYLSGTVLEQRLGRIYKRYFKLTCRRFTGFALLQDWTLSSRGTQNATIATNKCRRLWLRWKRHQTFWRIHIPSALGRSLSRPQGSWFVLNLRVHGKMTFKLSLWILCNRLHDEVHYLTASNNVMFALGFTSI